MFIDWNDQVWPIAVQRLLGRSHGKVTFELSNHECELYPIYYIRRNAADGIKRYLCFTFAATLSGLDAGARLRQLPLPSAAASRETRPPAESGKCALPFVCLRRISTASRDGLIHFHSKKNNLQGPRMPFVRAPTTEKRKRSEKEPNSFRSVFAPETHCA